MDGDKIKVEKGKPKDENVYEVNVFTVMLTDQ